MKQQVRYDVLLLQNILIRDGAELLESVFEVNSTTKLSYKCKCGKSNNKKFCHMFNGGCFCVNCMDKIKEEKRSTTCINKYGQDHPPIRFFSEQANSKREKTMMKKYGTTDINQIPGTKEKRKATCLRKFGTDNPSKHPEIRAKISKAAFEIHAKRKADKAFAQNCDN
jgi:hypothetical protein